MTPTVWRTALAACLLAPAIAGFGPALQAALPATITFALSSEPPNLDPRRSSTRDGWWRWSAT